MYVPFIYNIVVREGAHNTLLIPLVEEILDTADVGQTRRILDG